MIFDDSLEYDGFFPANGAELISMKKWQDIKLSEIWIPSELLPNRDAPLRLNSDKPVLYHTLERPKPVDSLSVYSELDLAIKENNSEKLLDSLEDFSYDKRWEECEASILINEDCQSSFDKECNSNSQGVFDRGENSFSDLLEHLCLSDSDTEDLAIETKPLFDPLLKDCAMHLENNLNKELGNNNDKSVDSAKSINKFDEFTDKSGVLQNDNSNEKDFSRESAFNHNELSKIAVSDCEVINVNCKPNELINSDNNNLGENELTLENISKDVSNSNVFLQKHEESLSNTFTSNNSILQNPNVDNISKADSAHDTFPLNPMFLCQKPGNEVWSESAKKEEACFDHKHTEADKLIFAAENEDSSLQNGHIISHPVLYTLSKKEEFVSDFVGANKRKVKKDKKPKKKTTKNIDLDNFFLSESEIKSKQPDVPDYLKYLMQKEYGCTSPVKSNCDDLPSANTVFPSLPVRLDTELFGKIEEKETEDEEMSLKLITNLLKESSRPATTDETVLADPSDKRNEIKIVIENIPLGVDNETMESILQSYGTITRLNLRRHGIFLKADIWMCLHPHIEDPEWIIECLNGSQPFGVSSSGEELKCYLRK